jgi:Bacterial Ig domain
VFHGWLGDRSSYSSFSYGSTSWQCSSSAPVGINPAGCMKSGHSIDGVLPDDQRRGGNFTWPPPQENYVYEGLQGAIAQAVILHNAGYDTFNWENKALLRAFQWLHEQANFPADGDDTWEPHVVNHFYSASFPAPIPSNAGKNVGWTDWTHSGAEGSIPPPPPPPPPPGDTTDPTISLTSPTPGTISGTASISASADDNIGVVGVQFYIGLSPFGSELASSPYSIPWNTTGVANGDYTLTARARDASGNEATSAAVIVTVSNLGPPPPPPPPPTSLTCDGSATAADDGTVSLSITCIP